MGAGRPAGTGSFGRSDAAGLVPAFRCRWEATHGSERRWEFPGRGRHEGVQRLPPGQRRDHASRRAGRGLRVARPERRRQVHPGEAGDRPAQADRGTDHAGPLRPGRGSGGRAPAVFVPPPGTDADRVVQDARGDPADRPDPGRGRRHRRSSDRRADRGARPRRVARRGRREALGRGQAAGRVRDGVGVAGPGRDPGRAHERRRPATAAYCCGTRSAGSASGGARSSW